MSTILFDLTAGTDIGLQRTNNEDNFIVNADLTTDEWFVPQNTEEHRELGSLGAIMAVADGMGGVDAGEVASGITIDTIQRLFSGPSLKDVNVNNSKSIEKHLKETIQIANDEILRYAEDNNLGGMGTTVILSWIINGKVYIAWCGDSRAYAYHPKTGLRQLTKDHSYVQELVDKGKLQPEYAFDHPDSNIITRSLGDSSKKIIPDIIEYDLYNDETILLCSDGLSGVIRDNEIEQVMQQYHNDIDKCKKALINAALDAGGYDNVTVALYTTISGAAMPVDVAKTSNSIRVKRSTVFSIVLLTLLVVGAAVFLGWNMGKENKHETGIVTDSTVVDSIVISSPNDTIEKLPADTARPPVSIPAKRKSEPKNKRITEVPVVERDTTTPKLIITEINEVPDSTTEIKKDTTQIIGEVEEIIAE